MFEIFLKANLWKIFESKTLAKFWKLFERQAIVFAMAAVRLRRIPLHLREKIVRLINEGKSQREVHRRRTEKYNCYFADPLPVYLLITVKTNARVNTRGSRMLPTNRAMRSDCRRRSHTQFGGLKKPFHYWRGTLRFTNCEIILKASEAHYDDDCLDVGHLGFLGSKYICSFHIAFKNLKASWQFFSSDLLSKFWNQFVGKFLKAFWKQISGKFLKVNRWQNFES